MLMTLRNRLKLFRMVSLTQGNVALFAQSGSIKSGELFKVLFHEFYAATP